MAVLTFVFLVCSFRVNVIFMLLLLGGEIAFSLPTAALFIENEALGLVGASMVMETAGNIAAAVPLLLAGQHKLMIMKRLITVRSTKILVF